MMRQPDQHILFLATEYAAGMRPYASTIVHTLWQAGDHVLMVAKDDDCRHDFDDLPASDVTVIDYPTSKFSKLAFRLWPSRLLQAIDLLVEQRGIKLIYCLTGELVLVNAIKRLQRHTPLLYTVHDATGHDSRFEGVLPWLNHQLLVAKPQQRLINLTTLQATNSHEQQRQVASRHRSHQVWYFPFPTLVSSAIAQGDARVPELQGVAEGYILFFGNVQLYKGVHLLYEAYLAHPELRQHPLVIAGSGYIYFKRRLDQESGITFINRYIDDSELRDLFTRAAVVVYPYISATQSGVTSIASYFDKPMVLSDLPFFQDTCAGCGGIEFFGSGDSLALAAAIERSLSSPSSTGTRSLYDRQYSRQALLTSLETMIADVLHNHS